MSNLIPKGVKKFFQSVMKPSSAVLAQTANVLRSHRVPQIKFRHGNMAGLSQASSSAPPTPSLATMSRSAASTPAKSAKPLGKPNATTQLPTIEDWQLPQRFRRRPIDPEEIASINRGGCD